MSKQPPKLKLFPATDYKTLLGSDWETLHPAIRERFSLEHCHKPTTYRGTMQRVSMSFAGRLLGQLCRLIGTPLSYSVGLNVPIEVCVYPNSKLGGTTWDRYYKFAQGSTNRVRSTKIILPECGLIEVAVSGFGMYSKVYADDGAIVFESKRFFFTVFGKKIPLPHLLSPGKTIACQRALNHDRFEFTLRIRHPMLGLIVEQMGIFREQQ